MICLHESILHGKSRPVKGLNLFFFRPLFGINCADRKDMTDQTTFAGGENRTDRTDGTYGTYEKTDGGPLWVAAVWR